MDHSNQVVDVFNRHFDLYRTEILEELVLAQSCRDAPKDILVVVHDQLKYLQTCVESIQQHTKNYRLYIWDNASGPETAAYLDRLLRDSDNVEVMRSEENLGFIRPNNEMAGWGDGEYLILLNSDTRVFEGWDAALLGYLQHHPGVAEVGYLGGMLDAQGQGRQAVFGSQIDYVCGWCCCLPRCVYSRHDLFDPQITFAYCEDADLSLKLKAAGHEIYALHLMLVHHFENKTILAVEREGGHDLQESFRRNHEYLRNKWSSFFAEKGSSC